MSGRSRAEDAQHADERGGDPEVGERPGDRAVGPDVAEALAQLAEASTTTACSASVTAWQRASCPGRRGGAAGSVTQKTAATRYSARRPVISSPAGRRA